MFHTTNAHDATIAILSTIEGNTDEMRHAIEAASHVDEQDIYLDARLVITYGESDELALVDLPDTLHINDMVCTGAATEPAPFTGTQGQAIAALAVLYMNADTSHIVCDASHTGELATQLDEAHSYCAQTLERQSREEAQLIATVESMALDMFNTTQNYALIESTFDAWRRDLHAAQPLSQDAQEVFQAIIEVSRKARAGKAAYYAPGFKRYACESLDSTDTPIYGAWYNAQAITGDMYHVRKVTRGEAVSVELMEPTTGEIKYTCTPAQAKSLMGRPTKITV